MEAAKRRPPRGGFYWMPPIGGSFSGESISMAVAPWPWWRCNNNDDKKNNSNENKNKNYYVCYPFPWKESMSDPWCGHRLRSAVRCGSRQRTPSTG